MTFATLAALVLAAGAPALPEWMAGCWEQLDGTRWTEECWTVPRGGIMLGGSRTGTGDRTTEWEVNQIVRDDPATGAPLTFYAAPGGTRRTAFAWSPDAGPGLTFRNATNDYPQRIRYWREGALLRAEIAMADGSRAMRWTYRPKR